MVLKSLAKVHSREESRNSRIGLQREKRPLAMICLNRNEFQPLILLRVPYVDLGIFHLARPFCFLSVLPAYYISIQS